MVNGIFVAHRGYLEGSRGGGQVCTREYIDVLEAAGIELRLCAIDVDKRYSTRVLRKLIATSYIRPAERGACEAIARLAAERPPDFMFLNQVDLAALAADVKRVVPSACRIVVLSHGLESTDLFHLIRLRRRLPLSGHTRPSSALALGYSLLAEQAFRRHVDIVCALSPFDVDLEHWIGAASVDWLPRIVRSAPLAWRPTGERLGYFGTLDHAPNLEGLVAVLDRLALKAERSLRIRVVGNPERIGRWLANTYPMVDYLGPLDDRSLDVEAATWNAVLHPIFCHARGCSTKLATAIAWHLPIVTTTMGHRGYTWRDGQLIVADELPPYADECLRLLRHEDAVAAREGVIRVAETSPTLRENAARLRGLLKLELSGRDAMQARVSEPAGS
jgi:hypothetical protein